MIPPAVGYLHGNCGGCHQNTDNLLARAKVPADVCQKCHAAVATAYLAEQLKG